MSAVNFASEHGTARLHGSEGHYLAHLPYAVALGFLNADSYRARERFADIINPASDLHGLPDHAFGGFFATAWRTDLFDNFAWHGHRLDTFQISLNTALAIGGDPLKFACRFAFAGYPWVDGPHRAWLADIINEGLRARLLRGPHQGWDDVTALLHSRDDGPVVIGNSTGDADWPTPYLGGWFPADLGEDYRLLSEAQQQQWDERAEAWYEVEEGERWRISMAALRANRERGMELRPDTWDELYFGKGITVFDLLAPDRDERLERAFGLERAA